MQLSLLHRGKNPGRRVRRHQGLPGGHPGAGAEGGIDPDPSARIQARPSGPVFTSLYSGEVWGSLQGALAFQMPQRFWDPLVW